MLGQLPPPSEVIALCKQHGIRRIRLYDPNHAALHSLRGSGIELILGLPNDAVQSVATAQAAAAAWVQANVLAFPDVKFRHIAVGNEISPLIEDTSKYAQFLLPAMRNIQTAISSVGLGRRIKVSTAVETGLLGNSYPPSAGEFRPEVRPFLDPIVAFLAANRSPLLVNLYPYFSHVGNPRDVPLDYAIFRSNLIRSEGYGNLFDAMLDACYAALEKVNGGSAVEIVVSESGWPSARGLAATVENARIYNTHLVAHVKSGRGTPKRPNQMIETYVFAMFDENQKNPEYEKYWGLFHPNMQPKYSLNFS